MTAQLAYINLKRKATPYLLLLPSLALITVFKVYPIFYALILSFFRIGKGGKSVFAGFLNYKNLFLDPNFANSFWVTLRFCIIMTAIQIIFAILLALFLNRDNRFVRISRTLIYIPVSINMIIACTIWQMFFAESTGLANTFVEALGFTPKPWLTSEKYAFWVIIFICCWKGISYWMMFLLAGLQNISTNILEAAEIDGANYIQRTFYITLPMLKNSMLFVIVSDTLINLFMFAPVFLLTKGGPNQSTNTLMYESYRSAFSYSNYPRAYALVSIMMLMAIVVASLQLYLMRDKDSKM